MDASKYTEQQIAWFQCATPDARRGLIAKGTARVVYNGGHVLPLEQLTCPVHELEPTVSEILGGLDRMARAFRGELG